MTVPPNPQGPYGQQGQPGGQPPYGQQPGPYGQPPQGGQPQFGQQPGQFGQQPPPGQFGEQSGPFAAQQYGQQPDGFGGPGGEPPKKSPLPWILAGGGVVVIAVIVVLIFTLGGGGSSGSPQQAADGMVAAINEQDWEGAAEFMCEAQQPTPEDLATQEEDMAAGFEALGEDVSMQFSVVSVSEPADGKANAEIAIELQGLDPQMQQMMDESGESIPTLSFELVEEDGGWKVCGGGLGSM
ncbi:Rv0361 family membrane protein [Actinoalloteichus hymeniacidonis]|uniref:DUF4878 domain-containing protein n=1 Tax=Actinoalloteichus hymeniacidonis TaxID=340345 RepID=A0AAC9HQ24_9PSEU|nr:hypothetical protein [Actinoalloteichus hymeniacidonis]AOS63221.1 hypothetical protein TL08_12035 [Actinoalloteichus hymeniacidonis]MBB5908740.1 hypothetical protein [Actinoalloteichus hymeniacidonis]